MVPLDSPLWSELEHAYGAASDIPPLLRQLENFPAQNDYRDEPWFALWSSLYHQGDIFDASFAAVPHLFRIAASAPERFGFNFFLLPVSIEAARFENGKTVNVPDLLAETYSAAWRTVPGLVAACAIREWDDVFCRSAVAAVCAAKQHARVAGALLELSPDVVPDFFKWLQNR